MDIEETISYFFTAQTEVLNTTKSNFTQPFFSN